MLHWHSRISDILFNVLVIENPITKSWFEMQHMCMHLDKLFSSNWFFSFGHMFCCFNRNQIYTLFRLRACLTENHAKVSRGHFLRFQWNVASIYLLSCTFHAENILLQYHWIAWLWGSAHFPHLFSLKTVENYAFSWFSSISFSYLGLK